MKKRQYRVVRRTKPSHPTQDEAVRASPEGSPVSDPTTPVTAPVASQSRTEPPAGIEGESPLTEADNTPPTIPDPVIEDWVSIQGHPEAYEGVTVIPDEWYVSIPEDSSLSPTIFFYQNGTPIMGLPLVKENVDKFFPILDAVYDHPTVKPKPSWRRFGRWMRGHKFVTSVLVFLLALLLISPVSMLVNMVVG